MMRQIVRTTAGKVLRSEDMVGDEQAVAARFLRAHPELGNPHVVRCGLCHAMRTLFRDESESPFQLTAHGWTCETCHMNAASQEIKC